MALGAGAFVVASSGDDNGGPEETIVLEPIGQMQEDDFAGNLDVGENLGEAVDMSAAEGAPDNRAEASEDTGLAGQQVDGGAEAVYGGSRDSQVCDINTLVTFLTDPENAEKAEAWAEAQGIQVGDIPSFIETLTSVRLRWDTRVTNHGFRNGRANPFQSVLQAGTAVLVDDYGVPRAKCACGNPLLAPQAPEGMSGSDAQDIEAAAQNPDAAWQGFDPNQVINVTKHAEQLSGITIVDFSTGELIDRPIGSDGVTKQDVGTGDVQITLEWASSADLDLHVIEPDGTEIYWEAPGPTATEGFLDVDANAGCEDPDGHAGGVENVFWPTGGAPDGNYVVRVHGFDMSCDAAGDFTLTIKIGADEQEFTGSVTQDQYSQDFPFEV